MVLAKRLLLDARALYALSTWKQPLPQVFLRQKFRPLALASLVEERLPMLRQGLLLLGSGHLLQQQQLLALVDGLRLRCEAAPHALKALSKASQLRVLGVQGVES